MEKYKPSLARLKRIAQRHPNFLAYLFSVYQEYNGLSDEQLAVFLECSIDALPGLALCQRPRPFPDFRQDVERMAQHYHVNATRLAQLVRNAEAHDNLRHPNNTFLLAARDREKSQEKGQNDKDSRA